jgi:hypothetical protein
MTPDEREQRRRLLHRLWTKAVGTAGYDKREWKQLEALLLPECAVDGEAAGGPEPPAG